MSFGLYVDLNNDDSVRIFAIKEMSEIHENAIGITKEEYVGDFSGAKADGLQEPRHRYKMKLTLANDGYSKHKLMKLSDYAAGKGFVPYIEDRTIQIIGTGLERDFCNMGILIDSFEHTRWLLDSLEEWLFYDSHGAIIDMVKKHGEEWIQKTS